MSDEQTVSDHVAAARAERERVVTLGQLNDFAQRHGLGPDTQIYFEALRDDTDVHTGSIYYENEAKGIRAEITDMDPQTVILTWDG